MQIGTANLSVRLLTTKRLLVKLPGDRTLSHTVLPQDQDRTVAFGNVCHCQAYLFRRNKWTRFEYQVSDHSLLDSKGLSRISPLCNAPSKPRMAQARFFSLGFCPIGVR